MLVISEGCNDKMDYLLHVDFSVGLGF